MVVSWILNAILKEIAEASLYTTFAKDLWEELEQRFEETNGPLLFQLKREIFAFSQSNRFVMMYFTKLKKMWDELSCLHSFPACTCSASKAVANIESDDKLMQFLLGLNEIYDHVKN